MHLVSRFSRAPTFMSLMSSPHACALDPSPCPFYLTCHRRRLVTSAVLDEACTHGLAAAGKGGPERHDFLHRNGERVVVCGVSGCPCLCPPRDKAGVLLKGPQGFQTDSVPRSRHRHLILPTFLASSYVLMSRSAYTVQKAGIPLTS